MTRYLEKLVWKSYKKELNIDELDKFADHEFNNGIKVRISTGQMAHTNPSFPYEVHIAHPTIGKSSVPLLNDSQLNELMNKLSDIVIELN